jgi:methylase of polypeptide subunit release factors
MLPMPQSTEPPADPRWLSSAPPPRRLQDADDTLPADAAFRLAAEGTALIWRGDFQNARQLLQALGRRLDKRNTKVGAGDTAISAEAFHRYRMQQAQRARLLGQLLIPLDPGYAIPLRRAPDVVAACEHALQQPLTTHALLPLRELQGLIGAYEWYRQGVPVETLGDKIHPHYGVFAPVRAEYLDLVMQAPLPTSAKSAVDLGTGTGVIAALLAKRGVPQVLACDVAPRAIACARDNLQRLGLTDSVECVEADLLPETRADLIVCNPPWLPGKAGSSLEAAVYDPDSRLLRGFLDGLATHLNPGGEGWLILSDLAERLGLRTRAELDNWIAQAGLRVIARHDTAPRHKRSRDADDPFHAARANEITSLWRLAVS